jgi:hypothetical protein
MEDIVETAEKASMTADRPCGGLAGTASATEASRGPRRVTSSALEDRSDRAEHVRGRLGDPSSRAEGTCYSTEWRNRPLAMTQRSPEGNSGPLESRSSPLETSSGPTMSWIGAPKGVLVIRTSRVSLLEVSLNVDRKR